MNLDICKKTDPFKVGFFTHSNLSFVPPNSIAHMRVADAACLFTASFTFSAFKVYSQHISIYTIFRGLLCVPENSVRYNITTDGSSCRSIIITICSLLGVRVCIANRKIAISYRRHVECRKIQSSIFCPRF